MSKRIGDAYRPLVRSTTSPLLLHVTTVDMSLELLLGPQLRAFRAAGYDVAGVSAPGPYVEGLEADGICHIPLHHARRSFSLLADVKAFCELYRIFKRLRPDIVHTHNPKTGVFGRIAARMARVPLVVNTQHGLYAQNTDGWKRKCACYGLERLAACFSHVELVQNEEDLATLRRLRVPAAKLKLLGNGIDLARFNPGRFTAADQAWARLELGARTPQDLVVGCVARLVQEKGILELIDAAEQVMKAHGHVRFAVIGPRGDEDSPDIVAALQKAERLGIRLLGGRGDVDRLYTGMDLFVLPSHREGFPRSVMEASAMGLPVVGTRIRGMRQAIRDGETGMLVPIGDPAALAAAITTFIVDPDQLVGMGRSGRHRAQTCFDDATQVAHTLIQYRRDHAN